MDNEKLQSIMASIIKSKKVLDQRDATLNQLSKRLEDRSKVLDERERQLKYRELRFKKQLQDKKLEV